MAAGKDDDDDAAVAVFASQGIIVVILKEINCTKNVHIFCTLTGGGARSPAIGQKQKCDKLKRKRVGHAAGAGLWTVLVGE